MRSVNKVTLLGNVGNDPESRTTPNGAKVVSLSLATSRQWKNAAGEPQEKTEWHKLIVWGTAKSDGLAGVVERYVRKGAKLYVEGRIDYRQYEDKDKQTRYVTEINVTDVVLLGGDKKAEEKADKPEPREDFEEFDDDTSLPF